MNFNSMIFDLAPYIGSANMLPDITCKLFPKYDPFKMKHVRLTIYNISHLGSVYMNL